MIRTMKQIGATKRDQDMIVRDRMVDGGSVVRGERQVIKWRDTGGGKCSIAG